ncbi:hypothetical protein ACL1EU_12040 [Corynebacterium striatum]
MDALPFINSINDFSDWWQLALVALPVWMLIVQMRRAGLVEHRQWKVAER